jgi:septal ring factor EnvC (AmiA/AmiB activator)
LFLFKRLKVGALRAVVGYVALQRVLRMKALLNRLKEALIESAEIVERSEADLMNMTFDLKRLEVARHNRYAQLFDVNDIITWEDRH